MTSPLKRSVTIAGHRTSLALEQSFWAALKELACSQKISVNELVRRIDAASPGVNLSSAVRVHLLAIYREKAACAGRDATTNPPM